MRGGPVAAEARAQPIAQPPGVSAAVLAPVADENASHR